ncbi:hypothetical protein L5515_006927 [Caenorhabditis briggsae]|uniref:Uncharacterized protein n=1 Tax=Caenorhabditis briggsae TaxID=6238 RepID=A0AAE9JK33_CAEBR|nr:hypothetical protein L5515_006927 [Caenorhabditis briggsae]
MIQYIILGYLLYEILRLAQRPDVSAVKFSTPDDYPSAPVAQAQPPQATPPSSSPEAPKSEETTAKSG